MSTTGIVARADVERWVAAYERAWRSPGTERLAELFDPEATYLPSPWARPARGLDAIGRFWEAEREGADESFTMSSEVLALDGETAVVRVAVEYDAETSGSWRDLWVLRFGGDARCVAFEEWPFAPDQPGGHQP